MSDKTKKAAKVDFKQLTYVALDTVSKVYNELNPDNPRKNEVILFTTIGMVFGTRLSGENVPESVTHESSPTEQAEFLFDQFFKCRNQYIERMEAKPDEFEIVNHSNTITLCNVTIKPYENNSREIKLSNLVLFPDQIVGTAMGVFEE